MQPRKFGTGSCHDPVRAGRKTRNSLARSTRSLMARLELDSFYNEPAHFITSQLGLYRASLLWLASCSRAITSQVKSHEYEYRGLMVMVVSWTHGFGGLDKNFVELWINRWMNYIHHC